MLFKPWGVNGIAARRRKNVQLTNNCRFPVNNNVLTAYVNNCKTVHIVGPQGASTIQCVFPNFSLITNGETTGAFDFTLRAGLEIIPPQGGLSTFYRLTFNGAVDVNVPGQSASFGHVVSDPLEVTLLPGTKIAIRSRQIPTTLPVGPATVSAASGTGTVATLTLSSGVTFPVGATIVVSGMTPSGYNTSGATVTASSAGSVSYASTATGAMTVAGTVTQGYAWLTSHGGSPYRGDGILSGSSTSVDYTLGGEGEGAYYVPVISSGQITSCTKINGGQNYTSGGTLHFYQGGASGAANPNGASSAVGLTIPGSGAGVGGYGVMSGGAQTSVFMNSAYGSGYSSSNPPIVCLYGGGGFGAANTATYGPCLIFGNPLFDFPSLMVTGDSITNGYQSVDGLGDINGNYGFYEQVLNSKYAMNVLAVNGQQASGNLTSAAQAYSLITQYIQPDYAILALATNDYLTNLNSNVLSAVAGELAQLMDYFAGFKTQPILTTVMPSTFTSTSSATSRFTTLAEQSAYNTNYGAGSYVDQHNANIRSGAGAFARAGGRYIDPASLVSASGTGGVNVWRVDQYGGGVALVGTDAGSGPYQSIHPTAGAGIPFLVANMSFPNLHS